MLQRTHNCNDAEIAEVSSICAFAIRPREQQHCRMCRRWSAKNRTEATASPQSRETERARETSTHRENNQEKRRATMRQTETSNNTTNKQDKTREQQIIRQIKLKKKDVESS